jgi:hypothetical protein
MLNCLAVSFMPLTFFFRRKDNLQIKSTETCLRAFFFSPYWPYVFIWGLAMAYTDYCQLAGGFRQNNYHIAAASLQEQHVPIGRH